MLEGTAQNNLLFLQGFLDALGVLAEGMDTSYEDVIRLLEGDHEKGTANESLVKSSPRKSIQRPSIVAQAWRKPSFAGTSEMLPRNDRWNFVSRQWMYLMRKQHSETKLATVQNFNLQYGSGIRLNRGNICI